jgi:protein KRI1
MTADVKEEVDVPTHPWGALDEDEFDEQAEEFETAYNFRFEEPCV